LGSRRFLVLLFLFALLVRGSFAWRIRDLPTQHALVMDARHYDEAARAIVSDGWWPRAVFYQAPLYPYSLAAVYQAGGSRAMVRLLQTLAGALTAVLLSVATARLFGAAAGRAAGVLAALYGPFIFYAPLLLKTTLTLLAETLFLLLLVPPPEGRRGPVRLLLAGAALGAAVLLQENLLVLAPCTALFLLLHEPRRWASALAFTLGTALAVAPVTLLNYQVGHELVLTSSQGGMNFYIGNASGASGTYAGLGGGSQDPRQQEADAKRLAAEIASRDTLRPVEPAALKPGQVSSIFLRETLRQIRAAPLAWMRLLAWKTRLFWNAYEIPDAEGYRVYRHAGGAVAWPWLGFGLVAPLGLAGLILARRRPEARLLALLAAGVCASVVLFFVFGRYRLPVVPFLIPPAGYAVVTLADLVRQARREPRRDLGWAWAAAGLTVLFLAVNLPAYTAAEVRVQDAAIWFNLSSAALRWAEDEDSAFRTGAPPEAAGHLERAIDLAGEAADDLGRAVAANPGFAVAHVQRAVAFHRQGLYLASGGALEPALAAYAQARQALTSLGPTLDDPGLPETAAQARELLTALDANTSRTLTNLGAKRIESGDLAGAEAALHQAIALAPGSAGAYGNLGLCLLQKGEREASRGAFQNALDLAGPAAPAPELAFYRRGLELASAAP
jgi:tetratricopeptide (TPR) repeat protein